MDDQVGLEGAEDLGGRKVRIYPVTRIQGRGDIEVLFDPDERITEARFRGLDFRGMEELATGVQALRAPVVLGRTCGTCGLFHQLASCMALESACGTEVPDAARAFRELVCWLKLASSHLSTIMFSALPDFALPMSDAAVKNITGIYMIDQDSVTRLSNALGAVNEALEHLAGSHFRPAVIVPGGVSRLPDGKAFAKAADLLAGCEDDLRETMRLAEMLTRRESKVMDTGSPLSGYYMASTCPAGPALIGDEVTVASFDGGESEALPTASFVDLVEKMPVEWSYIVPLAVKGRDPAMVGPLARLNLGFGEDTPLAQLECRRIMEQWKHPLDDSLFFLVALACEAIWGWEKARGILGEGAPDAEASRTAVVQISAGEGCAVVDSPRGILAHALSIDDTCRIVEYRVMSPLQFCYRLMNAHLTEVASRIVRGIEVDDATAARLQLAVRSFNPCVPCGAH